MNCCKNPEITQFCFDPDFTHKYCRKCGSHLYGGDNVLLINKKDWEEWVNSPGDGISFEEFQRSRNEQPNP